jgi:hypothetical protein
MQGCQIETEALGQNYTVFVGRGESVLLPARDSRRSRGFRPLAAPIHPDEHNRQASYLLDPFEKGRLLWS